MISKKTVVVEIDEQGNSSIDLAGFHGEGCARVAKDFRGPDLLKKSVNKREFNAHKTVQQPVKQRT